MLVHTKCHSHNTPQHTGEDDDKSMTSGHAGQPPLTDRAPQREPAGMVKEQEVVEEGGEWVE